MLYVVMLGGRHPGAKIEVHDVVFAQAETLQHTYPQLRDAWFGSLQGLHVDSWLEVDGVDGQRIEWHTQPPARGANRLYFINLGGYERGVFGEAHRYLLVSARNKTDAKALGKLQMAAGWLKPHTDALLNVDDCLAIDQVGGLHLHLVPGPHKPTVARNDYIPI
ncbi:DUF1543 domain-containing protein [Pseudomonas sp. S60]|uniref:DUF1543 domain-containing protein n=1 Tax=unclassified Pseudomonas TaxID=196821 RepID=UPI001913A93D|nr:MULTISPECIES: DUF1543 domain-containing protein [unclassified Pseudomonas]MBK5005311.1 DUF1543 domain-containing protein [Pseudomonas sp. S32]MBK5011553.1 DUF1543 domain-containing protein [Pseudomonas sp. S60]